VTLGTAPKEANKEIAQALFVTVKAVEVHLSSVYRKLQINPAPSSPTQSAGFDEQTGLTSRARTDLLDAPHQSWRARLKSA
jgi:DNA-binding NarL/FixJ family response regulator